MRKDSLQDKLIEELYKFNQSNRLDFYSRVKVILEQSQCAIISKPYWTVTNGSPGGEVFTIFPELECTVCEGERFKSNHLAKFTNHVIFCLSKKDVQKGEQDTRTYVAYGIVPKAVKLALFVYHSSQVMDAMVNWRVVQLVVDAARAQRDHQAVCIAPVLDHPHIKELANVQRKERDKKTEAAAREVSDEETMGPTGPVLKVGKGAEMPLDRSVWIQTPLTSELATLLLAGMQPIRHSSTGIHIPVVFRDTGVTKVIHLHVDRFEELAAVRMAQQNWEKMKVELQHINVPVEVNGRIQRRRGVATGHNYDALEAIIGNGLSDKPVLTNERINQKIVSDIQRERAKAEKEKNSQLAAVKRLEDENRRMAAAHANNSLDETMNGHGDHNLLLSSSNEQPGCSKSM